MPWRASGEPPKIRIRKTPRESYRTTGRAGAHGGARAGRSGSIQRANCNCGRRHRRPGQRVATAQGGPCGHRVRGGRLPRRAYAHGRRDAGRRERRRSTPAFSSSTIARIRALTALFAELGVATVASEMSFSARIDGAGIEWSGTNLPRCSRSRAMRCRPDFWRMLARHRALQSRSDRHGGRRRSAADRARRLPRPRSVFAVVPRLVPAADGCGDLVVAEEGCRELLPADVRALLPQSRAARAHQPAAVAHGRRRRADLRRADRRASARRPARDARDRASGDSPHGVEVAARGAVERFDEVVLACHSDQALRAPRRCRRRSSASSSRRSATSPTASCCTPTPRCCRGAARVVGMELPRVRRSRRHAAGRRQLSHQPAAAACPFRTPVIVTLNPPFEPERANRAAGIRVRPPAAGRTRRRRRSGRSAAAGRAPHVVRRRVAGLRLPRGRPAIRARSREPASRVARLARTGMRAERAAA